MLPTIIASRAVASSANGSKKPLKNAEVLKIDFLIAMYSCTASFLYYDMFCLTAGSRITE
jgi:hypothetical protein